MAVKKFNGRDALLRVRDGKPNTDAEHCVPTGLRLYDQPNFSQLPSPEGSPAVLNHRSHPAFREKALIGAQNSGTKSRVRGKSPEKPKAPYGISRAPVLASVREAERKPGPKGFDFSRVQSSGG